MNIWANCDNCKHDDSHSGICDDCYATRPPSKWEPGENYEPPTNADRIRSMSDEELANTLNSSVCPPFTSCNEGQECIRCWTEWLQQPAEEVQPCP